MPHYYYMQRYRYVKMVPVTIRIPILPIASFIVGFSLLSWVAWPILSFQLFYPEMSGYTLSPLSEDMVKQVRANESVAGADLTRASNWFPGSPARKTVTPVDSYIISIPKLKITDALVKIGTDDLSKNLVHYGGTALPGKYGNAVVFGHSVLPAFFNPNNYLTIFSLLPTLKEGDDIYVHFDGIDYRYEVVSRVVTSPDDVSGLEQHYDNSYVTLVTCTPPGTLFKRLWVTARLRSFES